VKSAVIPIIVAILIAGFVVSNHMSYQDGLDDQAFKCRMIAEGTYPDVDNYFATVCKS